MDSGGDVVMFQDQVILFSGGISAARVKIFAKIWTSYGGIVKASSSNNPLKRSSCIPVLDQIDILLIENKNISKEKLMKQLSCHEISSRVKIIHCQWLERCAQVKRFIDWTEYEIHFTSEAILKSHRRDLGESHIFFATGDS